MVGGGGTGGSNGNAYDSFYDQLTDNPDTNPAPASGETTISGITGETTANMQADNTFIDAGWDQDIWNLTPDATGSLPVLEENAPVVHKTITLTNGSGFTPSITPGSSNQAIGRFTVSANATGSALTRVTIRLDGTRTGASNFKLWQSDNDSFESESDTQKDSEIAIDPGDLNYVSFAFDDALTTSTVYYFLTCDVLESASGSIQAYLEDNSSLTFFEGEISSTITNAPLSSGDATLPVTLSSFTAQYLNDTPTLCWTTQSETSNAGWNIYRGETSEALSNEEAYLLNLSLGLIPGAGSTSEPTDYSFEDFFPVYQGNTYFYWLESVDYSGESEIYGPISLTIPENEWENPNSPEIPKPYGLHQNYPNPFNPSTEISFMMKESCFAELSIYNVKGEKIKTIFTNESIPRDELKIYNWNGKDESSKEVSTGVYYYKLRTTKGNFVRKMILMK